MTEPNDAAYLAMPTAAPAPPPRWYCVAHDGAATLCTDEDDARSTVEWRDHEFSQLGPHVAVLLAPLSAAPQARYQDGARPLTAADLADALGCFWNGALGAQAVHYDATARACAGALAEGFAAVEARLLQIATPAPPQSQEGSTP